MRLIYMSSKAAVAVGDEIITASGYWRKVRVIPPQGGMVVPCEGFDGETIRTPLKTLGAARDITMSPDDRGLGGTGGYSLNDGAPL